MAPRLLSLAAAVLAIFIYYYTNELTNVDVHAIDEEGFTALHNAAGGGHLDKLRSLISHGADINALHMHSNRSGLHLSALMGHEEALSLLIAANASLDITDKDGDTPLHLAAYGCHISCVRRLVEAGADIHIVTRNSFGHSALHLASSPQHPDIHDRCAEVARALISAGVNPDIHDNNGVTPLLHAINKNATAVVKALIDAKADLSLTDQSRRTVLHIAAYYGTNTEIISTLLRARMHVNALDQFGKTALDYCRDRQPVIEEVCHLLENSNGKVGYMLEDSDSDEEDNDVDSDEQTETAHESTSA